MSRSIDRLTSLDRLMLGASKRWPQDIGALAILDGTILLDPAGELRIDAVREAIASRLHLVPRFRQVIHVPGRGLADCCGWTLRASISATTWSSLRFHQASVRPACWR
jgi:hypothetical protein